VLKTRFSVVEFGPVPQLIINLHDADDKQDAFKAIDVQLKSPEGLARLLPITFLMPAVEYSVHHLLLGDGIRRNAEKVLIMVIDHLPDDTEEAVMHEVNELNRMNVKLITAGPGNKVIPYFDKLTTWKNRKGPLTFESIDTLPDLIDDMQIELCEEVTTTSQPYNVTSGTVQ